MGRYLKNRQATQGEYAVILPVGSSTVGPQNPENGMIRWNSSTKRVEFWYETGWQTVAKVGSVGLEVDEFTGDNSTTTFTMSQAESDASAVLVQIGGVYQQPNVSYTMDGSTTITFTSAPPAPGANPNKVVVVHNINSTDAAYG